MSLLTHYSTNQPWPEQGAWTLDDWMKLPSDGRKYEVINGDLHVSPAPRPAHQYALGRFFKFLSTFTDNAQKGETFISTIDVKLPQFDVPFQPDLVFIAAENLSIITDRWIEGVPDLVAEVLSPSNWIYDREDKMEIYETSGIPEYWIVDPRLKTVEIFVLEPTGYYLLNKFHIGESACGRQLPEFKLSVGSIFR